jgi:hypothetical protein
MNPMALLEAARAAVRAGADEAPQLVDALRKALRSVPERAEVPLSAPRGQQFETARINAAMPVEQGGLGLDPWNTAQDRAAAMGYTTPAYHGTTADIRNFDPAHRGRTTGAPSARRADFFASDPDVAASYSFLAKPRREIDLQRKIDELNDQIRGLEKTDPEAAFQARMELGKLQMEMYTGRGVLDYMNTQNRFRDAAAEVKGLAGGDTPIMPPEVSSTSPVSPHEVISRAQDLVDRALDKARATQSDQAAVDAAGKRLRTVFADLASRQAPEGANVLPVVLKTDDFTVHDFGGRGYRDVAYNTLLAKSRAPGVAMRNTNDPGTAWGGAQTDVYAVKDPSRVRLRNAAFDPPRRLSADLLASYLMPMGALGGLGTAFLPDDDRGIR